jgi:hypothetical protein
VQSVARYFGLDVFWFTVARLLVRIFGYLPTRALPIGNDDEPAGSWSQSLPWVSMHGSWTDPCSGFEYGERIRALHHLPPTLYVAGVNDRFLGHPVDVLRFHDESITDGERTRCHASSSASLSHAFRMFGSAAGQSRWKQLGIPHRLQHYFQPSQLDYDHVSMLAAPSAQQDVYPHVLRWFDTHTPILEGEYRGEP